MSETGPTPTGARGGRPFRLAAVALAAAGLAVLVPARARAQFIDGSLPRGGELRTGLLLSQSIYDRSHVRGGGTEPLGAPFGGPLDARFFPELADLDTAVANLLSALGETAPGGALSLGVASLDLQAEVSSLTLDLVFGVTSWLAVGGELPFVRARVFARPGLDTAGAGAGLDATAFGRDPPAFFAALGDAISDLDSLIASGTLDPSQQAEAEALRARAQTYASGMQALSDRYGLFPTGGGAAGRTLSAAHDLLATDFGDFGIGFPALDLADPIALNDAFTRLADSLAMPPFGDADTGYRLGDAALRLLVQPVNTFRPTPPARPEPLLRVRALAEATRRFPTGSLDRADRAYDIPTGLGSGTSEARAALDLALRQWIWLTLYAEGVFQEAFALERRVTPPDSPLVGAARTATVRRSPGTLWRWTAAPRYNLNESVSLGLLLQGESRGRDRYAYEGAPIAGVDADVLGAGSDASVTRWGFELRYRSTGPLGEGRTRRPLEAVFSYLKTSSADGRVPSSVQWRVGGRLYP